MHKDHQSISTKCKVATKRNINFELIGDFVDTWLANINSDELSLNLADWEQ